MPPAPKHIRFKLKSRPGKPRPKLAGKTVSSRLPTGVRTGVPRVSTPIRPECRSKGSKTVLDGPNRALGLPTSQYTDGSSPPKSIYPGILAGKPSLCPKCHTALQQCPRCKTTSLRCNSMFSDWENNCSQPKCHGQRLVCAKCKRPV